MPTVDLSEICDLTAEYLRTPRPVSLSTPTVGLTQFQAAQNRDRYGILSGDGPGGHQRTPLAEDLRKRFDLVVGMNESRVANKGTSMATFALCGCIGGFIDNPATNTLFHYDPLNAKAIARTMQQQVSQETKRVHFFVPGVWEKNAAGKYEMQPEPEYPNRLLAEALERLQALGVEHVFHCYNEMRSSGNDYLSRHQGTAWITSDGQIFSGGLAVQSRPAPPTSQPSVTQPSAS